MEDDLVNPVRFGVAMVLLVIIGAGDSNGRPASCGEAERVGAVAKDSCFKWLLFDLDDVGLVVIVVMTVVAAIGTRRRVSMHDDHDWLGRRNKTEQLRLSLSSTTTSRTSSGPHRYRHTE